LRLAVRSAGKSPDEPGLPPVHISSGNGLPRTLRRASQPPVGAAFLPSRQCPGSTMVRLQHPRRGFIPRRPRFRGFILQPVGTSATGFLWCDRRPGSPGIPPPWGFPHPVPRVNRTELHPPFEGLGTVRPNIH